MKNMTKRLLSLVLCFVMIVGLVPFSPIEAKAADETIYVLAGGDYQEAGDHSNSSNNVANILTQIKNAGYSKMDGFLFIGDYDCETHNDAGETAAGITSLMDTVDNAYTNINNDNSVLVQGNHDFMDSRIDATGGHDFEGYSVFVLNEDDYVNGGGSQSQNQQLAAELEEWLRLKKVADFDDPIFITSHLPLAFTPRTVTQGDAKYAKYLFDVLNAAGAEGLNIIFLHGHDHAYGPDNYMGGEAVYLAEGDKICIAKAGSTSEWTEETLNFTYMNAGYTGYYSDPFTYVTNAGTDKLTMTVFAITDSEVSVERFSANGRYNLKSAGYDGSYSNTSVTNQSLGLPTYGNTYASPQTIELTTNSVAEDSSTIGNYVEVAPAVTDDVTASGNEWTTITEPVAGTTTYAYTQADSITRNGEYVIVADSDTVALMDNNGSMGNQTVTINGTTMTSNVLLTEWVFSNTSSGTVYNGTRYLRYNNGFSLNQNQSSTLTFTDNGSNFRIYNNSSWGTDYSFYYNGSSWTRSSSTQYVRLFVRNEDGDVTTGGTNGLYGRLEGELTYNVAAGTSAEDALAAVKAGITIKYANAADYSDETTFEDEGEGMSWVLDPNYDSNVPGDYAVTISYNGTVLGTAEVVVPAVSTYYIAEGRGIYAVAMNTSAADAMAAVKEGISVYAATDANGANKHLISDNEVTWNWVDTYNGANNGPYTVEILKDGLSLGTVEVKVDVRYESGLGEGWTYVGDTEATGGTITVKYTLDTDGIDYGESNKYIIVDDNEAIALHANSSSAGTAETITIVGNTATTTTRDYEYHVLDGYSYNGTAYHLITKGNGSQYLYQEANAVRYGTRSSVKFRVEHMGSGLYRIRDIDGDQWCVVYNGSWTVLNTTNHPERVRFYKYTGSETVGGTPGGPQYVKLEGNTAYSVPVGTSATKALAAVKAGITAYLSSNADGTGATELDDSKLTWTWKNKFNGQSTGAYYVEISYNGVKLGTVQVNVIPGTVNNYPEYPNEGAVKVSKTATGIDFQASGVAQVEVAVSGVPSKKGADVIIMLDTSSSMAYCLDCVDTRHDGYVCNRNGQTRAQALEESLANLITQFKKPGPDGQPLDIDVAIADFNGFYGDNHSASGTPYDRDAADTMADDIAYTANSQAKIYTGTGKMGTGAFVPAEDLAASYTLNYTSGTNYDYAFDAIYQLATAKKAASAEERDLYVIFMSDGAAMQWNYYHSQGASNQWENWITGKWNANQLTTANLNCTTHAYYYDTNDHDNDGRINEHRMANAIKGDPSKEYEVIRKTNDLGTAAGKDNLYMVPGLGAKLFSIAFDPRVDTNVEAEHMVESIATLASDQTGTTQYFYNVDSADELSNAFNVIGAEIAYAAYNARFVDQMGDNFDLQMTKVEYLPTGEINEANMATINPQIQIISYDIWTRADYLDNKCTLEQIGVRKGTSKVMETVTFTSEKDEKTGEYVLTGAYSDKVNNGTTNILANGTQEGYVKGVIYASTFIYNTNSNAVAVEGVKIPTKINANGTTSTTTTNLLPSETFYWKVGTVQSSELAMRYYVYLEGSMEGTKPAGSYETNEFATIYYDNYLGNPCYRDTVSPTMGWKEGNVSYAFYLVNENGEVIVNQATGETGTFANKVQVTNPVVYDTVLLNNVDNVRALEVQALAGDVLPKYYTLYDEAAVYTVTVNSNSTGEWVITKGNGKENSTYVTHYSLGSDYSNALTENDTAYDYTHTVVWFAVVWSISAHPDSVVVDYGLPVDIAVLSNDMFGDAGKLDTVTTDIPWQKDTNGNILMDAYGNKKVVESSGENRLKGFSASCTGKFGTATVDPSTNKVTYQLNKASGMKMDTYDQFAYAVLYSGSTNPGYYYDVITVIPATTIYYEDNYLTYTATNTRWVDEGSAITDAKQDEDRPGKYSLSDANNIYGSDNVNKGMSKYSLGTAKKVTVTPTSSATAEFSFCGTGFDVVGMTSSDTGVLVLQVYNAAGTQITSKFVDTYYGVSYNESTGEWETVKNGAEGTPNQIYQVPVLQISNLPYGQYRAVLTAAYYDALNNNKNEDKTGDGAYDLYIDAIRIYDPANDGAQDSDSVIEDAYAADGERWPTYLELRHELIQAATLGNADTQTKIDGVVFIDGDKEVGNAQLADYISYGPNNEVYLMPGQSVAFMLTDVVKNGKSIVDNIHIGLKSADGAPVTYTFSNIAKADIANSTVKAGDYYNARTFELDTTTDMYYDLTDWKGNDIIVITNTGNRYNTTGILSITKIKATYTENPNNLAVDGTPDNSDENNGGADAQTVNNLSEGTAAQNTKVKMFMTRSAANTAVAALSASAPAEPEVVPPVPETEPTEPETEPTEPETEPTEPKTEPTEPETEPTEPETEPTEPETEPTEPEEEDTREEIINKAVKRINKAIKWLFKWLIG